jgi:hypothetical protein
LNPPQDTTPDGPTAGKANVLFANTPSTKISAINALKGQPASDESPATPDQRINFNSLYFQCRTFCYNDKDPNAEKVCSESAPPIACTMIMKCTPTGGSAFSKTFSYSASDASQYVLRKIEFDNQFEQLSGCEFSAKTVGNTRNTIISGLDIYFRRVGLRILVLLGLTIPKYADQSQQGVALLIDTVDTSIFKCV